jgi:hypothetical protein
MDPLMSKKIEMAKCKGQGFTLYQDFEKGMEISNLLSFLRFVAFDGDLSLFDDNEVCWEVKDGVKVLHGRSIPPLSI